MDDKTPQQKLLESKSDKKLRETLTAPIIIGQLYMVAPETQTTVGAAGGASALPATPTGYLKLVIGDTEFGIPYYAVS